MPTNEEQPTRGPGCGSEARHYSATPTQCTDPFHHPAPEQEAGEGVARGDKPPVECPLCGRSDETIRRARLGDDRWMCGSCYAARGESERTIEVCPRCEGSEFVEGVMTTDDPAVCAGCGYGVTPRKVTVIEKADRSGPFAALAAERDRLRAERDKLREAMSENPLPSPHEGEAARCDGNCIGWGCPVHDQVSPMTTAAPTEPRSISEEQLERDAKLVRERVLPEIEGSDEGWALDRVLAAYEQAEARVREFDREREAWAETVRSVNEGRKKAEAERDTAQASEARLRALLGELASRVQIEANRLNGRHGDVAYNMPPLLQKALDAALASTPDPEPPPGKADYEEPWVRAEAKLKADHTPPPDRQARVWTLARLNGDGHLTKWAVIEDDELHRAVLSDPLWEVVTVREAAPSSPDRQARCDCESRIGRKFLLSGHRQDGEEVTCPGCGTVWVHSCDEAEGCTWRRRLRAKHHDYPHEPVEGWVERKPAPSSPDRQARGDWEVRSEGMHGEPPYAIERGTGDTLEVFVAGLSNYEDACKIEDAVNREAPSTGTVCDACDKAQRVGDEGWEASDRGLDYCPDCWREPAPSSPDREPGEADR